VRYYPPFMSRMFLRRTLRRLLPRSVALQIRRAWLGRRIAGGKGHFEDDVPLLETYVNSTDICWDIGANNGTYTLHLSKLARKVFAFEPVPHSAAILQDVKRLASLDNVVVSGVALSDRVGRAKMTVPVDGFYGGFYLARLDRAGELDVELSTVDALIASGIPEPDFIKCDVEGAESNVIAGARELIARRHPIWLLETFDDDVVTLLRSLGYDAFVRDEHNRLVEVLVRVHERNYWFFPPGSARSPAAVKLGARSTGPDVRA
jgi:FkbM family methyltransferase